MVDNVIILPIMNTREEILKYINSRKGVTGRTLTTQFKISRQALNKHIRALIKEDEIIKSGTTRGTIYLPFSDHKIRR